MKFSSESRLKRYEQGVALIIVLACVVLLTGVVVAYFSRSMSERQLSNSSLNQTKAEVFAKSATDIIVSDLKQEIVNGSAPVTVGALPNTSTVYTPTSAANMLPMRSGNPAMTGTTDPIPNLVRRSVSSDSIASPGVASRASQVNSTTDVSANGRSVSLARWNQHYFIPRLSTATTPDSTPVAAFTAPDWVLVTSDKGPTVLTSATLPAASLSVVGRYAYAIYDEGGLLDMNVAGYPGTDTGSPSSTGLTQAQIAQKGALALADLTQVNLTQQQVNQIVGWRNYATAKPSGSFSPSIPASGFAFTATNATAWLTSFVTGNTSGFLSTSYVPWNNRTDQRFLSRQQLISMQSTLGFSQDALQYLGTFSREINAPTFSYPTYSATYTSPNPVGSLATPTQTNPNYSRILGLRMSQAGTANDGFTWKAGDPLLCRRFPLGRLALVAYNATNVPPGSPTPPTNTDIYKYFGLYRTESTDATDASKAAWIYTGSSGTLTPAASIKTLVQVAAETPSREPNFFELLKAAIHQDSLGAETGFPTNAIESTGWVGDGDAIDGVADLQILRIGANIIDQADTDSYPTVIQYAPIGPTTPLYAYGIEDLPYVNALGFRCVDTAWSLIPPNYFGVAPANRSLGDQIVPALWNPHRSVNNSTNVPSDIQLFMVGWTNYVLGGTDTYNDGYFYPTTNVANRVNEMGLGGFDSHVNSSGAHNGRNGGYIDIPASQFGLFAGLQPSLIPATVPSRR